MTKLKKKLLISTDNFLPRWDGISRFLAEMIPRLKDTFDITVISPDLGPSPADNSQSFKLVKVPLSKFKVGDFAVPKLAGNIIKREVLSCDLVFNQTIGPVGALTMAIARRRKKKVVCYIHSVEWELATRALGVELFKNQVSKIARAIVRGVYRKADVLVFPAISIAEVFNWHKIRKRYEIIQMGVDTKRFCPPDNKEEAKRKLGIDPDAYVVGYHGRIAREKDLMTLLRAFVILRKKEHRVVLLIVGDGVDSIKKRLASVRSVQLPGTTNNPVPYLQAMDVYVLPSLTETTSLATLEAMACSLPVVVTKVGFVKDYVKEGKTGFFFRAKDSYDLATELEILLSSEERRRIGSAARRLVEKQFDWDVTAHELKRVLEEQT